MKITCTGSFPQGLDQTLRTCDGGSKLLGNQFTVKSVVWKFSTSISCEVKIIIARRAIVFAKYRQGQG